MKVLVTGSHGYIGNALMWALTRTNHEVKGSDNFFRERWVQEVGGCTLTRFDMCDKHETYNVDLTNYDAVKMILQTFKPQVIIHLASQPSGPYSDLEKPMVDPVGHAHRVFTQTNNMVMLHNLLDAAREIDKTQDGSYRPKFVVTTTTGVPGAPDQPIPEDHTPNMAGSSYHVSRGFDSANLYLNAKVHRSRILELRTRS